MQAARTTAELRPAPLKALQRLLPSMAGNERVELHFDSLAQPVDSSNLGPRQWLEIAQRIATAYNDHDGFVVLHGTDTMAWTASALAFLLENLAKPVVLTGSQLPASHERSDAMTNFVNAVHVAAALDLPLVPEVAIVFADRVLRGCRSRKMSTESWAAFDSPNYPALGRIGEQIEIDVSHLRAKPSEAFHCHQRLSTRVMDFSLVPGLEPEHLSHVLLGAAGIDAVVLRTYGAGNAPMSREFLQVLEQARMAGKLVVNVTQCPEGSVRAGQYESSARLQELGVVFAGDMTAEAALTKLMWALADNSPAEAARLMTRSCRGELT
jgi:L-asparaginase